jgi:hypothetical protein
VNESHDVATEDDQGDDDDEAEHLRWEAEDAAGDHDENDAERQEDAMADHRESRFPIRDEGLLQFVGGHEVDRQAFRR